MDGGSRVASERKVSYMVCVDGASRVAVARVERDGCEELELPLRRVERHGCWERA